MKLTKEIRKEIANDIHAIKQKIAEDLERIISEIENPTGTFGNLDFEETVFPDWRKNGELAKKCIENCRQNLEKIESSIEAWGTIARP